MRTKRAYCAQKGAVFVPAVLDFENVSKVFFRGDKRVHALDRVSISVHEGEVLAVVGPSGCGKSTLLNLAAGLTSTGAGAVQYRGDEIRTVNTRVSYVTQKDNLLPWRNVRGNIQLPLELASRKERSSAAHADQVAHYIELVGLEGFERHYPSELSGGMRKRVALARALVCEPDVLLMDEPFGALDAQLKLVLADQLLRVWETLNRTLIIVTHDIAEAIAMADRVVVMSARPGHIRAVETVGIPRPRDVFSVRSKQEFGGLYERLWGALRNDILQGESA
jgi:NitT/TauT family transport system ATP-binding protein